MSMDVDCDKLIAGVQMQPALWDKSHSDYADRIKKENSWREVLNFIWGDEEVQSWDVQRKNERGRNIQQKWKNLRNSFAREVAKRKKVKSGSGKSWKTYIYFEQMSFLLPSMDHAQVESNLADEEEQEESNEFQSPDTPSTTPRQGSSSKKRKRNENNNSIAEVLAESLKWRQEKENTLDSDPDRLFLLSLLQEFKKVPEQNKAAVKIALISAINDGQYLQRFQPPYPNPFPRQNQHRQFDAQPPQFQHQYQQHFSAPVVISNRSPNRPSHPSERSTPTPLSDQSSNFSDSNYMDLF